LALYTSLAFGRVAWVDRYLQCHKAIILSTDQEVPDWSPVVAYPGVQGSKAVNLDSERGEIYFAEFPKPGTEKMHDDNGKDISAASWKLKINAPNRAPLFLVMNRVTAGSNSQFVRMVSKTIESDIIKVSSTKLSLLQPTFFPL